MSIYNGIIEVGADGGPIEPVLVLASRSGKKVGVIQNVTNIEQTHPLSDVAELSFDVCREVNGVIYEDWDNLKDFKLIQIPRENVWFEAKVTIDEDDDLIKHVTCTHANETELGQLNLYDTEINTEDDIARDDYKETFFYRPRDPDASLLHRILKDKAPHYSIYHVDSSLENMFRQFSFNDTSIQDALNEIAEECNCVFIYGEWNENDGKYHRTISAYDLEDYCYHCGKRGIYTEGHCSNCGSTNIHYGYGEDTGIFISKENLAQSITYETNTDEVKNCFRLTAGDDMMTSAIKSCNPNLSQYMWYFSDDMLEDMSDELAQKIADYTELVEEYRTEEAINISSTLIGHYNDLVEIYSGYNHDLVEIETPIVGTAELVEAYYHAIYLYGYLKTELSPASETTETTTASEQMSILQDGSNMSRVGISSVSGTISYTTANYSVASYARVYIDSSKYKVTASTSSINGTTWTGNITLTSYTNDSDTATAQFVITLFDGTATGEYVEWLEQAVQKAMANRESNSINIIDLFDKNESIASFRNKIKLYSLDNLNMMNSMATSAITVMVEQGVADGSNTNRDAYTGLYEPYYEKKEAIETEIGNRELQLSYLLQPTDDNGNTYPQYPSLGLLDEITNKQDEIASALNIKTYLGDTLWEELSFYRRENEYNNPNYISDGLTDSEIIEYAQRFYDEAHKEIVKSATLQHTISAPLHDFLIMEEFYPLQSKFKVGNWIRLQVDNKIYKLRLANWTIDYNKIDNLDVEFTDVVRIGNILTDTQSILSKSRSMSTTYSFVARQANKGKDADATLKFYRDYGIDFTKIKAIVSRGNTNIVYDDDGILLKRVDGIDVLPEQARIYNNGIYITKDAWETVSTGLGHYSYVDPETGQTVETYGIIADTVIGKLILGNGLKIYSESSRLTMGDDGLVITADTTNAQINNSNLFAIQKKTGVDSQGQDIVTKYLYVDANGNVRINGSTLVITPNESYSLDDAKREATNYVSFDSSGIMVADLTGSPTTPSAIRSGKNILIGSDAVKIRDGQGELASYGNTITIGETDTGENYLYIDSNGVNVKEGDGDATTDPVLAHFGNTVTIGQTDVGDNYLYIDSNGLDIKEGESGTDATIAHFGDTITVGQTDIGDNYVYIDSNGVDIKEGASGTDATIAHFGDTVTVGQSDSGDKYIYIDSNGVDVKKGTANGTEVIAHFGDIVRVGKPTSSHTDIDTGGMRVYGDDYGVTLLADIGYGTTIDEDNVNTTSPYYTFGSRGQGAIGERSFVEGQTNTASGAFSHAEGGRNTVSGHYAHVEGGGLLGNAAAGDASHVEGQLNTTTANAIGAHVGGYGNTARYPYQTIIGINAPFGASDDLFVVGNGANISNPSSAMRLKNDGHVEFSGAVGSGLTFANRSGMCNAVSGLSLQTPYAFFAFEDWSSTAGAESQKSFGTITRVNNTVWKMLFMCGDSAYKSKFSWNGSGTTTGTFETEKLYAQSDITNTLQNYATKAEVPGLAPSTDLSGYVTTTYLENNYKKTGQDSTYAKENNVYSISDVQRLFVAVNINDDGEALKYVLNSNCTRFKNAVDKILKDYGLIT